MVELVSIFLVEDIELFIVDLLLGCELLKSMISALILRLGIKTSEVILQISFSLLLLQKFRVCVPCDSLIDNFPGIRGLNGKDKAICEPDQNSQNDSTL